MDVWHGHHQKIFQMLVYSLIKLIEKSLNRIKQNFFRSSTSWDSTSIFKAPVGYLAPKEPTAINQGYIALKPKVGISIIFTALVWKIFNE